MEKIVLPPLAQDTVDLLRETVKETIGEEYLPYLVTPIHEKKKSDAEYRFRYALARAKNCFGDLDMINGNVRSWILQAVPKWAQMLLDWNRRFAKPVLDLYYEEHRKSLGDMDLEAFTDRYYHSWNSLSDRAFCDTVYRWCQRRWRNILRDIIKYSRDSFEETCSFREEFDRVPEVEWEWVKSPEGGSYYHIVSPPEVVERSSRELYALLDRLEENARKAMELIMKWGAWMGD